MLTLLFLGVPFFSLSLRPMDFSAVKQSLETSPAEIIPMPEPDALPSRFFSSFVLRGLRVDLIEPGRILCSMTIPPRLLNMGKFLHGGAAMALVDLVGSAAFYTAGSPATGSPLEISTVYLSSPNVHEEIEIEAKVVRAGKAIGVVNVDLREKKKNGKLFAQAHFTKYLAQLSKI